MTSCSLSWKPNALTRRFVSLPPESASRTLSLADISSKRAQVRIHMQIPMCIVELTGGHGRAQRCHMRLQEPRICVCTGTMQCPRSRFSIFFFTSACTNLLKKQFQPRSAQVGALLSQSALRLSLDTQSVNHATLARLGNRRSCAETNFGRLVPFAGEEQCHSSWLRQLTYTMRWQGS